MNYLPLLLLLFMLNNGDLKSTLSFIKNIDFKSFEPILNLLGIKSQLTDFLCSENFDKVFNENFNLLDLIPLLSSFLKKEDSATKKDDTNNVSPTNTFTKNNYLKPIKDFISSDLEEELQSYFN